MHSVGDLENLKGSLVLIKRLKMCILKLMLFYNKEECAGDFLSSLFQLEILNHEIIKTISDAE